MRLTNTILNEKGKIQLNIRAYDRENKEWVEDLNLMLDWSNYETMDIMHGTRKIAVNGTEVFEGDLVECEFREIGGRMFTVEGKVIYEQFMFLIQTDDGEYYSLNRVQNVKITGNIYDDVLAK